jgi:hypothetical protein
MYSIVGYTFLGIATVRRSVRSQCSWSYQAVDVRRVSSTAKHRQRSERDVADNVMIHTAAADSVLIHTVAADSVMIHTVATDSVMIHTVAATVS